MNIKKHVTSFETSKKLKEAGWTKETVFLWADGDGDKYPCIISNGKFYPSFYPLETASGIVYAMYNLEGPAIHRDIITLYPAPMLSEIMEHLRPEYVVTNLYYRNGVDFQLLSGEDLVDSAANIWISIVPARKVISSN